MEARCGNGIHHFSPRSGGQNSFQVQPTERQTEKCSLILCPGENGNYFVINWPISSLAHLFVIKFIFFPDIKHTYLLWKDYLPNSHLVGASQLRAHIS